MPPPSQPLRAVTAPHALARPLRIAMLAPPWISVPPPGYGGIEAVLQLLCEQLVARGHAVTLFAAPGSRSPARVHVLLDAEHPDEIGLAIHECDHVALAYEAIERAAAHGDRFDVLHDHSGFTGLAMADRIEIPVVHTIHGSLEAPAAGFYRRHGHKADLVAISASQAASAPEGVRIAAIVPNPIAVDDWPLVTVKDDYLLWIGRMDPVKGAHRAIEAARLAGRPLVLAGPIQTGQADYFRDRIAPHVDGRSVRYAGEVTGTVRRELFARAAAMLMPIRWPEPFGMVMVEALACGTPVIAFPEGAAREIVVPGVTGLLVDDEAAMAEAVGLLPLIDPRECRESVRRRYGAGVTADGYDAVYRRALARRGLAPVGRGAGRFSGRVTPATPA